MKQEEHLKLIRARCVELLEIASKRTPGEWLINQTQPTTVCDSDRECTIAATRGPWPKYQHAEADAAYIAACAGAAEAGWKATIAAIDGLTATCDLFVNPSGAIPDACVAIDAILAAWPLSLLQHQSP